MLLLAATDIGEPGSVSGLALLAGTDLYGPAFLRSCASVAAPCVASRTKVEGEIIIVVRVPAEDPMFR